MAWQIEIARPAARALASVPVQTRDVIMRAREQLAANPVSPGNVDVKALRGYSDLWRLRVGDWRIWFTFDSARQTVVVAAVLPRARAYRD